MTRKEVELARIVLAFLLALPATALAQSSISGTVKDNSDAVLPGVTVKIASPVMIEGTKEATTDGGGQYRFIDLRPGIYSITYSLEGFTTVERTAYQLLTDFNARLDVKMSVGTLSETITVTGAAPIVDVQSSARVAVLDRDAIDNMPVTKTTWGLGQLILGVTMSAPDVGGSASGMPTYMSMRGGSVGANNNTLMVDGMVLNALSGNGAVQPYVNEANFQEMSYQTAGIGAERSGGGVVVNLIPKEGGNRFSGSASAIYRPGELQGDNYSERFELWGLPKDRNGDPAINRVVRVSDLNITEGGPIQRDKLWFFVSARDLQPVNTVPNTFFDDGSQGVDDNYSRNVGARLTYQLSPRHKFSGYYERTFWYRGHAMSPNDDPETTAQVWSSPNFATMSAKYTGAISSKLLIDGGFAQNTEYYRISYQPEDAASNKVLPYTTGDVPGATTFGDLCCGDGLGKEPWTPAWFAYVPHAATGGFAGVAKAAPTPYIQFPLSQSYQASVSYVTGQHHAKLGFSLKKGKFLQSGDVNAHLGQTYPTGNRDSNFNVIFPTGTLPAAQFSSLFPTSTSFPFNATSRPCHPTTPIGTITAAAIAAGTATQCRAVINNFPLEYSTSLNYDLGIFLQDSYTIKRLTVNAGIRYEALNAQVNASRGEPGRFVPLREGVVHEDIPDWRDWAPRFQAVFDVFGDSKTAVKYSLNRYNETQTTGLAEAVNPAVYTTNTRFWTDLNDDDIAQGQRRFNADGTPNDCVYMTPGCEINLTGVTGNTALAKDFGNVGSGASYTNFPRRYRLEQGIEVEHALLPRVSLSGSFYHGQNKNLTRTVNRARTDDGTEGNQYRQVQLYNPLDGTPYTYYTYTPATSLPTAANIVYVEPKYKSEYDAYTAEVRLRPFAGAQLSGGIEFARTLTRDCESSYVITDADVSGGFVGSASTGGANVAGATALIDPNNRRFCDQRNMVAFEGGPVVGKPFSKNFKMSGAFPIVYGLNLGVTYQNLDAGGLSPTYQYGSTRIYPDGTQLMLGGAEFVPACPTAYGCSPGARAWVPGPGAEPTGAVGNQFPSSFIADERLVQLDIKVSKNLRFGRLSVQPSFEAFNLMNIDEVRSRASSTVGVGTTGQYLQPSTMLQGRILGFGVNVKW